MSLTKRLNDMERRIRELEQWKEGIELVLAHELADSDEHEGPALTLDGDPAGGERDQSQSLG